MAPNGEPLMASSSHVLPKPHRLSMEGLQRAMSDLSFELSKEVKEKKLPPISEVEDARCECCGMSEECTLEYIRRVREKYCGRWICGLCSEAVKGEMEKNGGRRDEAIVAHTNECMRFNRVERARPVLYQAEAMREILKKHSRGARAKSCSPKDSVSAKKGNIARSSSCIPAITREGGERMP